MSSPVVPLLDAFAPALFDALAAAVDGAMATGGVRRDLQIAATGGSARRYRVAPRAALTAGGALVERTYRDPAVLRAVEAAAGEPVVPVPYQPEEFLATRLECAGDVHDWHWDDYAYALVWVFDNPPAALGGSLELVADVPWDKANPRVAHHVRCGPVARFHPRAGTAYLLRAHENLHRVAPLLADARRDVLCFSYASAADLARPITHETMEAIAGCAP